MPHKPIYTTATVRDLLENLRSMLEVPNTDNAEELLDFLIHAQELTLTRISEALALIPEPELQLDVNTPIQERAL